MKIINCEQRSDEWYAVRRGIPTSSNFDKIVTMKGEPSKQADKYMYKLAGERVSNTSEETYTNSAMQRGIELEDEARQMYQLVSDAEVEQVGFCVADGGYACSPDGLVGENGLLEIKCPSMAVHVEYLLDNKLPSTYFQQLQGQLLVTGRKWCDFVSYFPGIKPLIVRVNRDTGFINSLSAALNIFCKKLDGITERIKQ